MIQSRSFLKWKEFAEIRAARNRIRNLNRRLQAEDFPKIETLINWRNEIFKLRIDYRDKLKKRDINYTFEAVDIIDEYLTKHGIIKKFL